MMDETKSYPDYKDSALKWLGRIPSHWTEKRAKYFLREVDERSTTGEEQLMSVSHKTGVTPRKSNVTMFKAESNIGHKICRVDDLAINTLWAWMSALGVSRYTGLVSPAYGVYRQVNSDNFDSDYLDYLLRTPAYATEYRCRSTGITSSRLRLYPIDFLRIPLIQPPREEQEKIVRYLKHQDALIRQFIRNRRRLIEVLTEQKQAIINRAVTRGLDPSVKLKPSGVDWLGDVPEHWDVVALKHVLNRLIDCEHKTAPATTLSEYFVVRTSAVKDGKIRWSGAYNTSPEAYSEWTQRGVPEAGDVIFTREAPAGEACIVPSDKKVCLGQRTVLMKLNKSVYNPQFLIHMIYEGPPRQKIKLSTQGSTVGHFNMDDIGWLRVLRPPLREQEAINEEIIRRTVHLDTQIDHALEEIDLIQEFRSRLVLDAVTGVVDVTHLVLPPDVVAEIVPQDDLTDEPELDEELAHAED